MDAALPPGLSISQDGPLLIVEGDGRSPMAVDEELVEHLFREHGALLLRGFNLDIDGFRRFSERLCKTSVFNESPNRALLDKGANIQSVDLGTEAFPLHPELSREPWRPDACLFACFDPPATGGETTICDGVDIVRRLEPSLVEAMRQRRLVYLQRAAPDVLEFWLGTPTPSPSQLASPPTWCPYSFLDFGEGFVRCFARPLLHRPMFHDELAFGNFLLFARDYQGVTDFPCLEDGAPVPDEWLDAVRAAAGPITYAVAWQRDDLLILDNSRFMHGRRPITDAQSRTIASYFGYVGFAPPNEYEPVDAPWRRGQFKPPMPPRR